MNLKLQTSILALLSIVLIFSVPLTAKNEEPVEFQDRELELAIRDKIGKATGNVYPYDLEELNFLAVGRKSIDNLGGISECSNLERLSLPYNNISDLSPLSNLTNLEDLRLQFNNITNLSPLSGLFKLQEFYLYGNNVSDIQPLVENFKVNDNGEKIGLGVGDRVNLRSKSLDLSESSKDLQDIQTLLDRGVEVEFYPQKE